MINRYLLFLITLSTLDCSSNESNRNQLILNQFYNTTSRSQHLAYLAEDYQLYFGSVKGKGMSKSKLAELLRWDYALNPDRQILEFIKLSSDTVILRSKEENDFSKLIKYPGWESVNTYIIDKSGLIKLQLYQPKNEISYKPYLEPAIACLAVNDSLRLAEVYDSENKRLIQDSISAVKWTGLLREWRASNPSTYQK
ncbi:hypothetical protein [Fulvivirga lutea]|uniref:Nuclear transport factor 2 family protein n=1 Tax=Fulvivirga lutea TaxID=2810512 RepID=A0A975A260_9BACT|nr:hypothetical protein [Fulvivirga lutea]QSE99144.1 hypothetical protein JR347_08665 [Fulvivirga lutea]